MMKFFLDRLENQIKNELLRTVAWKDNKVVMIDQTKLPNELILVEYDDYDQVANAIRTLVVRGAPAIGVSGAFGLALAGLQSKATTKDELISDLEKATQILFEKTYCSKLGLGIRKNNECCKIRRYCRTN